MNDWLTRPWGMHVELTRTSKASMAFLAAPLARVDEECMNLDGPTIIYTCCLSALAARAATGAPMVRVRVYRCVIGGTHLTRLYGRLWSARGFCRVASVAGVWEQVLYALDTRDSRCIGHPIT